jgi:hypothetical protein
MIGFGQQPKIMTEEKLIFQFARRPHSNLQESAHVSIATSSTTLRYVGSYGAAAPPHLAGQSVYFRPREAVGELVNGECQPVRLLPNLKVPKILHVTSSLPFD